jgi:hypothetical protein
MAVSVFVGNQPVENGEDALAVVIDAVEVGAESALKVFGANPLVGDGAGNIDILAKGVERVPAQEKAIKERCLTLWSQRIVVVSGTHSCRKGHFSHENGWGSSIMAETA